MMAVYSSVEAAAAACRGYVRFDGGGRWRVYGTKLVSAGGTVQVVRDLVLSEGFEPLAVPARPQTGRKGTFRPYLLSEPQRRPVSPAGPERSGGGA